jgi:hypothetical protein
MKLDPGMHIGLHLVFFGKSGVTESLNKATKKEMARRRGKANFQTEEVTET